MLCHFIACFWWAIGSGSNGNERTWVQARFNGLLCLLLQEVTNVNNSRLTELGNDRNPESTWFSKKETHPFRIWRTWSRPPKNFFNNFQKPSKLKKVFFLQNRQAGAFDELSVDASYLVCLLWAISLSPRINHVHVCLFVCSFVCLFVCLFVEKYVCFFLFWSSVQAFHVSLELKKKQLLSAIQWFTSLLFSLIKSFKSTQMFVGFDYIQNMSCTSPAPSKAWFENHHFLGSFPWHIPNETCGKTQGFQEAVEPISIQRRALRGCMEFLGSGWIFTLRWRMGLEYLSIFTINWSHKCR